MLSCPPMAAGLTKLELSAGKSFVGELLKSRSISIEEPRPGADPKSKKSSPVLMPVAK